MCEVSIVIISKNEEDRLPLLLATIKKQINVGYEVILSDAQSTDNTRKIANKHSIQIIEGGLPSKGRNAGADKSKSELLLFLDADVIFPHIEFLIEAINNFTRRKLDYATTYYKPITSKNIDKVLFWIYNNWVWLTQKIYPLSSGACIFCKKTLWKKINGFNEKMLLSEDYDFVLRAKKSGGKFGLLNQSILYDTRRFQNDGRLKTVIKYIYGGLARMLFGDSEKPRFSYTLHGHNQDLKELYESGKN